MKDLDRLLILNDHGDITVFATSHDALRYLEEKDIIDGSFEFYDALGYRMEPVVVSGAVIGFKRRPELCEEKKVAGLLQAYLEKLGHSPGELGLDQMVRIARSLCEVRVTTWSNYLRWIISLFYLALLVIFLHQCSTI